MKLGKYWKTIKKNDWLIDYIKVLHLLNVVDGAVLEKDVYYLRGNYFNPTCKLLLGDWTLGSREKYDPDRSLYSTTTSRIGDPEQIEGFTRLRKKLGRDQAVVNLIQ